MNNCTFEGNLVGPVTVKESRDGKPYCFGKIGCYNGKDKDGNERPSMFIEFTAFGKDVELLEKKSDKGSRIIVSGTFSREDAKDNDGRVFVNLKVVCNWARICVKIEKELPPSNDDAGWDE